MIAHRYAGFQKSPAAAAHRVIERSLNDCSLMIVRRGPRNDKDKARAGVASFPLGQAEAGDDNHKTYELRDAWYVAKCKHPDYQRKGRNE